MDVLIVPPRRDSLIRHEEKVMKLSLGKKEEEEGEERKEGLGERRKKNGQSMSGPFLSCRFFLTLQNLSICLYPYHLL